MAIRPSPCPPLEDPTPQSPILLHVTVVQTEKHSPSSIVEQANYNDATWSDGQNSNEKILTMAGTDVSGMLCFGRTTSKGHREFFLVAFGVIGPRNWSDPLETTCVTVLPEYYNSNASRFEIKYKEIEHSKKTTSDDVTVKVDYHESDGYRRQATITID